MQDVKELCKRDYDNLCLLCDKRRELVERHNATKSGKKTLDEKIAYQRAFKTEYAELNRVIENILRDPPLCFHGWPVSARVKDVLTGKEGVVLAPYTCAGEEIVKSGKVLVSGFGEYGVSPDSIIPA